MKIAIYSPYLDTIGGGEKYMMTIAETLSKNAQTDFLVGTHLYNKNIPEIIGKLEKFLNLDLSKVNFVKAPIGVGSSGLKRLVFLKKYDWFFYLTDGSIFYSTAKNSVVHFQVPFTNISTLGKKGKIKLSSWKCAIYNSQFTKEVVEQTWPIKGPVIYPPVDVDKFYCSENKKKQIVSVGRFFSFDKMKKHQLLIDTFKGLFDKGELKGWSLHLAGGANEGDMNYVSELEKSAKGYQVFIHTNISFSDLIKLYSESSIYWHAKGFGETDPKDFEHFGITTVEAMASGCVPVVVNLGGQKEIVEQGVSGYLWNSLAEWQNCTLQVAKDQKLAEKLSQEAKVRAKGFSKEEFKKKIEKLIYH